MSNWRRRMMPGIILAFFTYMLMSGLDKVHNHFRHFQSNVPSYSTNSGKIINNDDCPICLWHSMVVVVCVVSLVIPLLFSHISAYHYKLCYKLLPLLLTRSRAPPHYFPHYFHRNILLFL